MNRKQYLGADVILVALEGRKEKDTCMRPLEDQEGETPKFGLMFRCFSMWL